MIGSFAIVTGGNTGIGKVTALQLALKGADVLLTSRDATKGSVAVADIRSKLPDGCKGKIHSEVLDLSSLKNVKTFTEVVLAKHGKKSLDILILNVLSRDVFLPALP